MSVIEVGVAAALLAVLLASAVQVIRALDVRQRSVERRALVVQAVQNLSEQLGNLPWEQLTTETAGQVALPAPVASRLPGATLSASVVEEQEPVRAKRVLVELQWQSIDGRPAQPVRLTSWAFPET